MSSDFYPACLARNLVRAGTFGYRENVDLCSVPDNANRTDGQRNLPTVNFVAFPNFSGRRKTGYPDTPVPSA
ncbi:hypothetical protein J5N58_25520 [Rhizobium cremeum]|uniref:hypothetical protein n=1 Tax=Rhizobium cremeum TaxID=2813827 RepID=UPI001FD0D85A|nr:hypothetical protein [Rhizobium cremeum]MCJ7997951.1 hypothetical protein [Rhizobium cremeum]MCJ8003045.1 hypothetical protein [Rhizobium cremeum]